MADEPLFLDTNVWVRFLVRDDESKAQAVDRLLTEAEAGQHVLTLSHLVVAELEWTLRSFYRMPKTEIAASLRELLALRSLHVPSREVLDQALDLFERHSVDYVDAYNAAELRTRRLSTIVSYDQDFDVLGVRRIAPGE